MKLASNLAQDFRYAFRALRRSPAVALTAIFAIAIGIGASTAVFSVVDRILFRSLPYANDNRLVVFGLLAPIEPREFTLGAGYMEWRSSLPPFQSTAAYGLVSNCDLTEERPLRLACLDVESTLLPTLGVTPILGRNFTADEDRPLVTGPLPPQAAVAAPSAISSTDEAPRAALISYALWRGRFGGNPATVGRTISLDGREVRVVGVLPRDFLLPNLAHADVLVPLALNPLTQRRPNTGRVLRTIARLKPGYTPVVARQALEPIFQEELKYAPRQFAQEVHLSVRSLREWQTGQARLISLLLLGAVIAVLLIACANVANLLLARGAARQRERAVKAALGASRWRLAMQSGAEALVLAFMGGALGCALAYALLRIFVRIAPAGVPRLGEASLDGRVLLFAACVCLISAVLFGIAPALQDVPAEALSGARATAPSRGAIRNLLVAGQIAASLTLLSGATLLLRSLLSIESEPLGLNAEHVLAATITLGQQRYPNGAREWGFWNELENRLRAMPGIESLALSDTLPPSGAMRSTIYATLRIDGRPPFEQGTGGMVAWRSVTPSYFDTLRIAMKQGRSFNESDRAPDQNSMVLNQRLAARMFPRGDAVGQRIHFGPPTDGRPWFTVVGVADDAKNSGIEQRAEPEFYVVRQHLDIENARRASITIRTHAETHALETWIRRIVAEVDPTLPVDVESMGERVNKLMAAPRFDALLLGIFAAMAILLAAIGLYGVMAFLVAQRTQEIGVRMALGATPSGIAKLVLGRAARWTLTGTAIGLAASLAGARVMQSLLYHVAPRDPLALGVSLIVLVSVAMLAAFVPARRAAAVDPLVALRHE